MFAILETGGKQYKVEEGVILEIELLNDKSISEGKTVNFDSVLLIKDKDLHIGQPYVENATIQAKILETFRAPKIIVFKKKSKKQYKKKQGHRQNLQRIQIEKIEIKSKSKAEPKTTKKTAPTSARAEKPNPAKTAKTATKSKTTKTAAPPKPKTTKKESK